MGENELPPPPKDGSTKKYLVLLVIILLSIFVGLILYGYISHGFISFNSPTPTPTTTLTPTQTPTSTPKSVPTPTTTPTPTITTQPSKNIAISYSIEKAQSVAWQYGVFYPDSGNVFLQVDMTITNNGYQEINTNPYYFYVVSDSIKYNYDSVTNWVENGGDTVDVLDGGKFNGVLVFQVPESATLFTLQYQQSLVSYNVIYTKNP